MKILKFFLFSVLFLFGAIAIALAVLIVFAPEQVEITPQNVTNVLSELFSPPPLRERTNALIMGVDEFGLADVLMIASFNSTSGRIDMISIPRDTRIQLSTRKINEIRSSGRFVPADGIMKINELHSYAGADLGALFIKEQVEDIFGTHMHYYVRLDMDAFMFIIDSLGGVEFDVPARMFYRAYDMLIDLQPGSQLLNGHDALALVRFRNYPRGDLQRIEVQHAFMSAMIEQMLSMENLFGTVRGLWTTATRYMDTDFSVGNLAQYLGYVGIIEVDNIHAHTIPGVPQTINNVSFIVINQGEVREFTNDLFNVEQ